MAKASQAKGVVISIPPLRFARLRLRIVGDSFIIPHAWSEKAKGMLRDKGTRVAKGPREARNPLEQGSMSMYWLDAAGNTIPAGPDWTKHKGAFGIPCRAIKACLTQAATDVEGIAKTQIRRLVRVLPLAADACVPLLARDGHKLLRPSRIREDLMRVGGKGPGTGQADLRYRGEFLGWSANVEVEYDQDILSAAVIVNLFNRGGATCGLLEDRPEKTGGYGGMFHVETAQDGIVGA